MAAPQSISDLADGRYSKEPSKRKRKASGGFETIRDWGINSRYLMIHYFFNVMGEKPPRNLKKGKLPSIDANALDGMVNPVASRLAEYRSERKAYQSLENALKFVHPKLKYSESLIDTVIPNRVTVRFNTTGFGNVERIFSIAERSVPLNMDKYGRRAFVTPEEIVEISSLPEESASILNLI